MLLPKHRKGSALLTALFIMTLVAIVATAMTTRLQLDIYRTRLIITHDKLYLASEAVMFWALSELNDKNLKFTEANNQGVVDTYPVKLEKIYNQVTISGGLYDMQARFNLNNLLEKKSMQSFIALISILIPNSTSSEKINMTFAVKDWISSYDLSKGKDTYTSYYLSQKPPYYPSHQLMKSSSELRLVKDLDARHYLALEPFITVLPETTAININTASKQILMTLGNGLDEAQANELMMARGEQGISDLKEVSELLKKFDVAHEQITIESHYFLSVAQVRSEDFNLTVYTLFQRSKDKKGILTVRVIRQTMNSY